MKYFLYAVTILIHIAVALAVGHYLDVGGGPLYLNMLVGYMIGMGGVKILNAISDNYR